MPPPSATGVPPLRPHLVLLLLAALLALPVHALAYEGASRQEEAPPEPARAPVLTRPPALEKFINAPYPEEARAQGLSGVVGMIIEIRADGSVGEVEVIRPAGHGFDEAAVEAVRQFVFSPAEFDDVPAAVRIEYAYTFTFEPPAVPEEHAEPVPEAAGPVTLKGTVLERASRKPIAGAFVACADTPEETTTGVDGTFELRPPPGPCNLQITSGTHDPVARIEQIEAGKQLELTFYVMPKKFGLFQTVVRGEREKREAVVRTLQREELQKAPGTFGDPIRVIESLPGVARVPFGLGALVIRGAAPQETGVYIDGVQSPLLYHFLGGPSVVNAEMLERLDFYPGGFSVRYGRAIGGILDAGLRRGDKDTVHGSFQVSLLDSSAFLEAPVLKDTVVSIAARRSYVDVLLPLVLPDDPRTGSISVLPRYWDYQARIDHGKRSDRHAFSLMAFGSDDGLTVATSGGQSSRDIDLGVRTIFHRLRGAWTFRDGSFSNTLAPFVGVDLGGFGFGTILDGDLTGYLAGVRDEMAWELEGGHVLRLGADVQLQRHQFDLTTPGLPDWRTFPGERPIQPPETRKRSVDTVDLGLYSEFVLKAGERLVLIPGIRVDRFRLHGRDRDATDPRLTARFKLFEGTTLKGAAGHFSMAPDANLLDPELGNPELELSKAFQASFGVEQKITDSINVDVTGFYNRRYDLPVFSTRTELLPDGTLKQERFNNDGLGRAFGLEVLLRHEITRNFFGWLAYTLSMSEERRRGEEYVLGGLDQTHILAAVGSYSFGNGWELGARFRLVSGIPETPVRGATWDGDTDNFRSINGPALSERQKLFHQLDVRVDKTWLFDLWKLGVFLDVQNVYWADNVEFSSYDYRFRQKVEIPGIPILPVLGVKGSF